MSQTITPQRYVINTVTPSVQLRSVRRDVNFIHIDADESYYSTTEQIRRKNDVTFVDRSIPSQLSGSNVISGLMCSIPVSRKNAAAQRSRTYLSSSVSIDDYKSGIEITETKHWTAGIVKISAGTAGHLIDPLCIGINSLDTFSTEDTKNAYVEINVFDPVNYVQAADTNTIFPLITSDNNQLENYILNGIIEPIPIRPVISNFSINFPFEPQGVRCMFGAGNQTSFMSSDQVLSVDYYETDKTNDTHFLDEGETLSMSNDDNSVTVHTGPSIGYVNPDFNYIAPFVDAVYPRNVEPNTTYNSVANESLFLDALNALPPMGTSYIGKNERSATAGFVYNNAYPAGTDSIAFGGMLY